MPEEKKEQNAVVVEPEKEEPKPETAITTDVREISPTVTSPEALIAKAIDKGTPVETMEKLLHMRRELKAEHAKEVFDECMAEFQSECPVIKKTKAGGKTKGGAVAYYYAPLDSIVLQTKELIAKHGFSYAIKSETNPTGVKVTCFVKHEAGHSEESTVEVPLGTKTEIMSASQQVAAAITFAKRYAFCNAFGILTGDDDDDSSSTKELEKNTAGMEKLKTMIASATIDQLKDYAKKIKESKKYDNDQKVELATILTDRMKVLVDEEKKRNEKK